MSVSVKTMHMHSVCTFLVQTVFYSVMHTYWTKSGSVKLMCMFQDCEDSHQRTLTQFFSCFVTCVLIWWVSTEINKHYTTYKWSIYFHLSRQITLSSQILFARRPEDSLTWFWTVGGSQSSRRKHNHSKNMKTPQRKNPGPSCSEATVLSCSKWEYKWNKGPHLF